MVTVAGSLKIWVLENAEKGLRPLPSEFWISKTHTPKRFDIVVIGDSRIYRGIAPSHMESILKNMRILNFGYSSGGMNHILLDAGANKLDIHGRKIIILGITPYSLTASAALNEHYKEYKKAMAWPFRIPYLHVLLSPNETSWALTYLMHFKMKKYYQIPHDDGWVESDQIPENTNSGMYEYEQRFNKEKISKTVLNELTAQISIWKKQGYTVFAFRPPASEKMEALENNKSGYSEQSIKQAVSDSGGTWIDIEDRYGYQTYDGSHLNSQSAIRLSENIARFIANKLINSAQNR
jgi:hypothetical protein